MAYFAQLVNGVVAGVTVVNDEDCAGGVFPESESAGKAFIARIGMAGEYLQTDDSGSYRGKYAAVGDIYDPFSDLFVTPDRIVN